MNKPFAECVQLGRAICGDLHQAERREWWLGNGRDLLVSYGLRSRPPIQTTSPIISAGSGSGTAVITTATVWIWLLGHYALAEHRIHRDAMNSR